ncbi:SDR family NAD(P)-dependent oxidoreductase [Paenibacillus pinihumi]|uniref:SDR family NAD(P)-dependent oxidoreductase n=1 Tax=Paenibacillus pinihumi TaxID=669462 RepID=UPI000413DF0B|nr:SDR family NAD(P)-dependent oxidoreductase [Paenibacillus pinihumi]
MTKTVFVTGADRGLGFSLTNWLLEHSYQVFAGRYIEDWPFLDELKEKYPDTLELIPIDVGDETSVKKAARMIASKTRTLDLIINNAGIGSRGDHAPVTVDLDFEAMQQIYNVNTLGPLRVTNSLLGLLLQGTDKLVVNISSEAGSVSRNERTAGYGYCMSKSALNMQSSILHRYLTPLGGQVMVFHPGWMQSYMSGKLNTNAPINPDDSAQKIMALVEQHKAYLAEQPAYLDTDGQSWPW